MWPACLFLPCVFVFVCLCLCLARSVSVCLSLSFSLLPLTTSFPCLYFPWAFPLPLLCLPFLSPFPFLSPCLDLSRPSLHLALPFCFPSNLLYLLLFIFHAPVHVLSSFPFSFSLRCPSHDPPFSFPSQSFHLAFPLPSFPFSWVFPDTFSITFSLHVLFLFLPILSWSRAGKKASKLQT